jgi:hypothetical protein
MSLMKIYVTGNKKSPLINWSNRKIICFFTFKQKTLFIFDKRLIEKDKQHHMTKILTDKKYVRLGLVS